MYRVACWKGLSGAWLIGLLLVLPRASSQGEAELIFADSFENHDPVITSSPPTAATVGVPYAYDVDATDIDGDTLLYALTTSPAGMSINPANGQIGWTPGSPGNVPVAVEVTDGQGGLAQQDWVIAVGEAGADSDGDGLEDGLEGTLGTVPNDPDSDDDGLSDGAEVNQHNTNPLGFDSDDDGFGDGSELAFGTDPLDGDDYPEVPPDPATVAPELDASQAGNLLDDTAFLYTGANPIQEGVAPGTIELKMAALVRGKIITRAGLPLPGATVNILDHPEFGSTVSRADGMYDLAVNGGTTLVIQYAAPGYLPAQRTQEVPWQGYVPVDDIALIPLDPIMTPIDLDAPGDMKVARGSAQSDDDGSRQATILFPAGVGAELRLPDDSTLPISNLSVRATEYTVGEMGEMAMPGVLPPTSGYTYAVELSVDEAMAMGAVSVDFDQPLPFYVENFLGFPAGTPVPTGYYDRIRGAWVPAPDGLVIKIVGETGGMADIDIDGNDVADTGAPLAALGVTDAERTQIANLYDPVQSLWRVPVEHFTSWDHNWPIGPPNDADYPNQRKARKDDIEDGDCEFAGSSTIECQNQVLRERVAIAGTPFTLNYSSARTPGFAVARHLDIPLTDEANPASLLRVDARVSVAGQVFDYSYEPMPDLVQPLSWDGMDGFGRPAQGASTANVRIDYVYEGVYRSGGSGTASFGQPGQQPIEVIGNRTRADFLLPQVYQTPIGAWDARGQGLGGSTLSVHHAYDPVNQVLHRGDGTMRSAEYIPAILGMAAGLLDEDGYAIDCGQAGQRPVCGDGLPATQATLDFPIHIAFGPDGSMYIAERNLNRVRRIGPDGIIDNFAGTGESYVDPQDGSLLPNGDGGPALAAKLAEPYSIAVDKQGNIYIGEISSQAKRIRKVDTNGIITTYAGSGTVWPPTGPALGVIIWPLGMEVDTDGSLYVVDTCFVIRIDTSGQSSVIAGDPNQCGDFSGDGGPAILAGLNAEGIDLGPDGSIYLADSGNYRIRKITKDGVIQTVAGTGTAGFSGDGGLALNAQIDYVYDIAVTAEGGIFVPDPFESARLRYIDPYGVIRSVGGLGFSFDESGMFGPPLNAWLYPFYVELGPDGNLYLPLLGNDASIRVIKSPFSGLGPSELLVPAEDGSEVYKFNGAGRHLQTLHALTAAVLYEFTYDAGGRLATVTDGDGKVTTIQHDGAGNPTAIVAPFGHTTTFSVDDNGFLSSITNPAGESLQIQSTPGGLITQVTDPRGRISSYAYDAQGRLTSQSDNAGQSQTLVRSQIPGGFAVSRTTALGHTFDSEVEQEIGILQHMTNTAPDGSQNSADFNTLIGARTATSATGMTVTINDRADPRWGMQTPLVKSAEIVVPGGPTLNISGNGAAELSDPEDPFSVVSLTNTLEIDGKTITFTYTAASQELVINTPGGRVLTAEINSLGRIESFQAGDLAPTAFVYNTLGQLESLTKGTGPDMRMFSFTYGADGLLSTTTDPLMRITSVSRDAVGRITGRTLPGGSSVSYGWDGTGQLASITPPGRPAHTFTYTLHGQLQSVTPPVVPDTGPVMFAYNDDRQPEFLSRPGNQEVQFDYDVHGRINTIEYLENAVPTSTHSYTYGLGGRVSSITGPGGQVLSHAYLGDLLASQTWSGPVAGEVSWTYDNLLRAQSETVDGGTTIAFTYDDDNYLTAAGNYTITRSAANALPQAASIGVVGDSWTYNTFGEVDVYTATANAVTVYSADYTRDALGRITQKIETIGGVTDTYDYGYDMLGQLVEVEKNSVVVESYTYDANGNRLSATLSGVTSNGTYDDQDRLIDYGIADFAYSPAGRLESRTEPGPLVTTYDYDAVGNLLAVTLPDTTSITYGLDGLDRRVERFVNGSTTYRLIYDGLQPVAELDDMNNVISQFVSAGSHVPAYMIRGGVNYRLITDQIGSVRLVVNAATGAIAQRIDYDTFGNVLMDTNPGFQPFGFAGGIYDALTGLLRFGSRDYDPATGRWTAKDPSGFGGGDTNLYRYVNNQPVNLVDVYGAEGGWNDFVEKVDKAWEWFNDKFGDTEVGEKSKKIKKPVDKAKKILDKSQEYLDTGLEVAEIWADPQLNQGQKARDITGCFESIAQDIVDFFEDSTIILKALDVTPYFESLTEYMNMSEFGAGRAHYVDVDGGEAAINENLWGNWKDVDGY